MDYHPEGDERAQELTAAVQHMLQTAFAAYREHVSDDADLAALDALQERCGLAVMFAYREARAQMERELSRRVVGAVPTRAAVRAYLGERLGDLGLKRSAALERGDWVAAHWLAGCILTLEIELQELA
jgi:hypothetical protein